MPLKPVSRGLEGRWGAGVSLPEALASGHMGPQQRLPSLRLLAVRPKGADAALVRGDRSSQTSPGPRRLPGGGLVGQGSEHATVGL